MNLAHQSQLREAHLLDSAVDLFKQTCIQKAKQQECQAQVSFEIVSREIRQFPKRGLMGSALVVSSWGPAMTAPAWVYATRGVEASYSEGEPVLYAELLQSMFHKFLAKVQELGFIDCVHVAGTWSVRVTWRVG